MLAFNSFIDYRNEQIVRTGMVEVASIVKETRLKTISAETLGQYGLHIGTDEMVLFSGNVYDPASSSNRIFPLNQVYLGTNFSDGSDEVVFERLTGVPSATGTIVVYDKAYNSARTILITDSGLVEW